MPCGLTSTLNLSSSGADVRLPVRVIPRSGRTELAGVRDGRLVVRLTQAPICGAANEALIKFLSRQLRVPRRTLRIISGERGRAKTVMISHQTGEELLARFRGVLGHGHE